MSLLSPNTALELDIDDPFCTHHDFTSVTLDKNRATRSSFRTYIINAIGTFISKCFDNRCKFKEKCAEELKKNDGRDD